MSFWADKLNGTNSVPTSIPSRELFGLHQPVYTPQANSTQQSIQNQQNYQPNVRLKQGGRCPDCGSDKYMSHGSYAIACGECGYHPRFEQSGHGERSLKTQPGEATPARQSADSQTMASSIVTLNAGGGDHIGNA